jgi:AraC family transcriptional activator of pobA
MKLPNAIEYVEIPASAPVEQSAAFFLRRMQGKAVPPAVELPHRHNYQEILVIQSGYGRHVIDGHAADLVPHTVALIGKGQVHVFEHASHLTGWIVRFTDDFVPAGLLNPPWNDHAPLFNQLGSAATLMLDLPAFGAVERMCREMEDEWTQQAAFHGEHALRHLLGVLLIRLQRSYQHALHRTHDDREPHRVYQQFALLLEQHVAAHHDVQFYAHALQLAPTKLSKLLTRTVGKPTKQVIDERLVLEAKRYIHYTELPLKEIAAVLGYTDPFHLSKTFKRITGVTPQAYREQRQKVT